MHLIDKFAWEMADICWRMLQVRCICVLKKVLERAPSANHFSSVLQGVIVLNYVLCGSCHSAPTMEVWFHFKSMFVRAMPGTLSRNWQVRQGGTLALSASYWLLNIKCRAHCITSD